MTSNELLSQVRAIIDETEAGGTVSDSEIFLALSQAQDYIVGLVAQHFPIAPEYVSQLIERARAAPLEKDSFTLSSKNIKVYIATIPSNALKVYNISLEVLDNQQQEIYYIYRGIPIKPQHLKLFWSWRGRSTGRQDEFYYYLGKDYYQAGNIIVAIVTNNNSFQVDYVIFDYLKQPTNISASQQPQIIGFDSELIAYASYIIFNKLRLQNAQVQYQAFTTLISGKFGGGQAQ